MISAHHQRAPPPLFTGEFYWGEVKFTCENWGGGGPFHDKPKRSRTELDLQFSISKQLLRRNEKRFRGGLVFKAHRRVYHSTPGLTIIKKKKTRSFQPKLSVVTLCGQYTVVTPCVGGDSRRAESDNSRGEDLHERGVVAVDHLDLGPVEIVRHRRLHLLCRSVCV